MVIEAQELDPECAELKEQMLKEDNEKFFIRKDGALLKGNRLFMPKDNEAVKKEILDEAHTLAYAMHPGSTKLYRTIYPFYYWEGMKRDVAEYNLSIPVSKYEDIIMDFVYGLPRTPSRYDGIWVTVDRLTKTAHFLPVRQTYSLEKLAKLFVDNIVHLHGVPVSIVSNRDPRFTSRYHLSIGMAPFESLYEKACRTPLCWTEAEERSLVGPKIVNTTNANIQLIKANLKATQDRQKNIADKHSKDREFTVGDFVFLKLSPWKGVVRFGKRGKLSPRYVGPYQIIKRIGAVVYRLELPPELSPIHNVFHVSMLRKYVLDPSHIIQIEPLEVNMNASYVEEPVDILDRQDKVLQNKVIPLVKVL
nr:uncharacterized protein LOC114820411 [Malus domestica]